MSALLEGGIAEAAEHLAALDAGARRFTTRHDGANIVWRHWGEIDKPLVVLLHGSFGSWSHWVRTIPALATGHSVLVPDMPGFGDSPACPVSDPRFLGGCVQAGLDELFPARQYVLCGFSFGCQVGGAMLALHGGRIARFILIGAGGLGPIQDVVSRLRRWRDAAPERRMDVHRFNVRALMLASDESVDDLSVLVQARNTERTFYRRGPIALDLRGNIAAWGGPTTAIWGGADALVGVHLPRLRELVKSIAPGAAVHEISRAGHWVQHEASERVNRLLLEALAGRIDKPRDR